MALLVDRPGRWRPRTARAAGGGSGTALTAPGPEPVVGPRLVGPRRTEPSERERQRTRPYQTLPDQILSSRTTAPAFGECQIFPLPA